MRARTAIFVFIVAALCAAAVAGEREPAPPFTAKTLTGEKFTRDSVKGKVVLLQFWTTWCSYCQAEQAMVDAIDKEFAGKGLLVLAVNVGQSKKTVLHYLQRSPRSCRIVLNEDTTLVARFRATAYPLYVAIDRDGNIAGSQRGAGGEYSLRRLLADAGLEGE